MREDSPASFIRFRQPRPKLDAYGLALELTGRIQNVLEHATARFHLRDRLDRYATAIVIELSRAEWDVRSNRWRYSRKALKLATDVTAVLDILAAQRAVPLEYLEPARVSSQRLCTVLVGPFEL